MKLTLIKTDMFGIIAMAAAYLVVKNLDKHGAYKAPEWRNKNRYK